MTSTGGVVCDTLTSTNAIICNTSIACNSLQVGNTSYQSIGGNHFIDVQNPNAYMYFRINGETVASLTSRNQFLLDDPNGYGLNLYNNDVTNVHYMNTYLLLTFTQILLSLIIVVLNIMCA